MRLLERKEKYLLWLWNYQNEACINDIWSWTTQKETIFISWQVRVFESSLVLGSYKIIWEKTEPFTQKTARPECLVSCLMPALIVALITSWSLVFINLTSPSIRFSRPSSSMCWTCSYLKGWWGFPVLNDYCLIDLKDWQFNMCFCDPTEIISLKSYHTKFYLF